MNSPMLCHPWDEKPKQGQWLVEPKLDGVRALIEIDSLGAMREYSRNGLPLWNLEMIKAELKARGVINVVLDGEIYDGRSFDSTSAIVRTQYRHTDQAKLVYHVFDVIVPGIEPTLWVRKQYLKEMITTPPPKALSVADGLHVQLLPFLITKDGASWPLYIKGMHKMGYEGAVFKEKNSSYEYKRSKWWLKAKPTYDADLLVVGMIQGEGKYSYTLGALVVKGNVTCKGVTTHVQCNLSGMDDTIRDWFWARKDDPEVVGKLVVQVEFQNVTADGSLRFPRFVRLREDKV